MESLQQTMAHNRKEADLVVHTMKGEQASLKREVDSSRVRETDAINTGERKLKAVMSKLKTLEDEHTTCK